MTLDTCSPIEGSQVISCKTEKELINNGFSIVIYANHMMRSSYPAMVKTAKLILNNQRSYETEKNISTVKEMIELIR